MVVLHPEPTEEMVTILIVLGPGDLPCVYINDYRVVGPKPWGGGKVLVEWNIDRSVIEEAMSTGGTDG